MKNTFEENNTHRSKVRARSIH